MKITNSVSSELQPEKHVRIMKLKFHTQNVCSL